MATAPTTMMFTRRSIRIAYALSSPPATTPTIITNTTPSFPLLRLAHTQSHIPPLPHPRPTLGDCTPLSPTHSRSLPLRLTPITSSWRYISSSSFTSDPNSPTPPPPSTTPLSNAIAPPPPVSERSPLKITHPKKSNDGMDMLISITPRAADRLHHLMTTAPTSALRITVEPGGCHGFQYFLTLIDLPPELSGVSEEDTIFDQDGARVVIDESSLQLLNGSKVDYTMELIGRQFRVVDGPGVKSSCGCGTSFDVKI